MQQESAPANSGTAAPSQEGIQPGLADRADAMQAVARTRANLEQVAPRQLHTDAHGNILTSNEVEAIARGDTDASK